MTVYVLNFEYAKPRVLRDRACFVIFWGALNIAGKSSLNSLGAIRFFRARAPSIILKNCYYATRRVATERAKTLAIQAKYSTNKGL